MPQNRRRVAAFAVQDCVIGNGDQGRGEVYCPYGEPRLADLLGDPILHLLLAGDGVSLEELESLIEQARRPPGDEPPLD